MNTAGRNMGEDIGEDPEQAEKKIHDGFHYEMGAEDPSQAQDGEQEYQYTGYNRAQIMASFESSVLAGKRKTDHEFVERHLNLAMECLCAHNLYRLIHFVEPLRLCKKLCKYSRDWARYLAKLGHIVRRHDCIYGENSFLIWPTKGEYTVKGSEPADHWYSGIGDYSFGEEPFNLLCLNFTQMIWRDSRRFGAAIARGEDGKIFIVAHYEPSGNTVGNFPAQVPPPGVLLEGPFESLLEEGRSSRPFTTLQKECLQLHNEIRRRHGVPYLALHSELNKTASIWAKKLCEEDRHAYRVDNVVGENVFFFVACDAEVRSRVGVENAIESWYSEMKHFTFGVEPLNNKARNFCQMLWRSTRKMGVAVESGRGGRVLIVANYYPRGNVVGQYRDNVFPAKDESSDMESPQLSRASLLVHGTSSVDMPVLSTEPFPKIASEQSA